MKKITIAVCDMQELYRERLAEYLMHRKGTGFLVQAFSLKREFYAVMQKEPFDIVLVGRGFEGIQEGYDTGTLWVRLCEEPEWEAEKEPAIFRYQSAEEMIRKIYAYYLELRKEDRSVCTNQKEILAVYSPTRSRMQTPFALTLGQLLAEEKRVLYVNLGEWTGLEACFDREYERDLADLLYLVSDYGSHVQGLLESVLHTVNHMDYIPPMTDAQLLSQTGEQDYRLLLQLLIEKTTYDVIILDFGFAVPGFFQLLAQCTRILGVVDQGSLAHAQRLQFEECMIRSRQENLAEKMEYITFSTADTRVIEEDPAIGQWKFGILGDRARAVRSRREGLAG